MKTTPSFLPRGFWIALPLVLASIQAWAGEITGIVTQASPQGYLPGATVTLVELRRTESTASDGSFRFADVPAGAYTLQVQYVGFELAKATST